MKLWFIKHPRYKDAHPDDDCDIAVCEQCVVAKDAKGARYLLWGSNEHHWSLSRHDPRYGTDTLVDGIELIYDNDR